MIKLESALGSAKGFMLPQSDNIDYRVLAAATHEAQAIPDGAKWAVIHSDLDVYVKLGATPFAVPAADIDDGTGPIYCRAGTPRLIDLQAQLAEASPQIGLVAAGTPKVEIDWFA